ncbi:hypothetical protein BN1708_011112 [Verticillium longisporum]|uniref:YMC020W-like alpha/beta hydrolase domain-containing protein n=1 Tax=Verticillium longisporum TaxID=100787 RepID=A0A0G4KXT0_VERLO|nr:hypothetical protein BN1708_011112 [Verticillium longisporum]
MAPRKRVRPNSSTASSTSLPAPNPATPATTSPAPPVLDTTTSSVGQRDMPTPSGTKHNETPKPASNGQKEVRKSRSWYGSWPRAPKSSALVPQIARETILGGTNRPPSISDLRRFDSKKSTDSSSLEGATASATTLPNILESPSANGDSERMDTEMTNGPPAQETIDGKDGPAGDQAKEENTTSQDVEMEPSPQRPSTATGWFGWLGRTQLSDSNSLPPAAHDTITNEPAKEPETASAPIADPGSERPSTPNPEPQTDPERQAPPTASTWFGFWSAATPQAAAEGQPQTPQTPVPAPRVDPESQPQDVSMTDAPEPTAVQSPPPPAGSTWAFWSRDVKPKADGKTPQPETGEMAVIGQGSEAHPEPAQGIVTSQTTDSTKDLKTKLKAATIGTAAGKKNNRLRPQSMDLDDASVRTGMATPQPVASSKSSIAESVQESPGKPAATKPASISESPAKSLPPNLLLPSFGSTYHMKENPSILKQITQLLLRTQQPATNHVFRVKETPKVKKAIAIGVHGLFPATYLRPMVGQPTGTSLRLASHCAEGIRRWADAHGCGDCEIEKVALEGEGKIADRVDNLWKLLLNWIEPLRSADLIILACHSQGVPVAIMLVAKLIDLGIITNARIGVCAMAGVSLGPFPDYRSSMGMLMGTAAELWDFSNSESEVSGRYETALKEVLEYGARITYIGSIDDQLVPMESAIYSPASHPYIYRAVFIDGRIHAPDFIAHLVGFALKLRNLGVSDHGLIRELSTPLAGSLYSGEGHSRLYYDEQVYDLAVSHALETTNVPPHVTNRQCQIRHPHRSDSAGTNKTTGGPGPLTNPNPYHLPWIMRGLLEEDFVKTELSAETEELLRQFDDWKPTTKALKDVKYRLEAVRSKL